MRKPVPTSIPGGSPQTNAWLLEWSGERRELEEAERAHAAVERERDEARRMWNDEANLNLRCQTRIAELEAALTFVRGEVRFYREVHTKGYVLKSALDRIDTALSAPAQPAMPLVISSNHQTLVQAAREYVRFKKAPLVVKGNIEDLFDALCRAVGEEPPCRNCGGDTYGAAHHHWCDAARSKAGK